MDGDVEAHELNESGVLAEAEQGCQVPRVVLVRVDSGELALAIDIAEDAASNVGQLCNPAIQLSVDVTPDTAARYTQVHAVFVDGTPVVLLRNTLLVRLREA